MANAAAAAEERERSCRALLEELWRVRDPEAKAGQEKHATQALVRCKMWSGLEHDSDVHGDWSVQQTTRST